MSSVLILIPGGREISVDVSVTIREVVGTFCDLSSLRSITFLGRLLNEAKSNLSIESLNVSAGDTLLAYFTHYCVLVGGMQRHFHDAEVPSISFQIAL